MKLSQEWITKITSNTDTDDIAVIGGRRRLLKLTHHVSILTHEGPLLMLSLIPLDPTQEVKAVTVTAAELARIFAFIGGSKTSPGKAEAARRNGTHGGRPKSKESRSAR